MAFGIDSCSTEEIPTHYVTNLDFAISIKVAISQRDPQILANLMQMVNLPLKMQRECNEAMEMLLYNGHEQLNELSNKQVAVWYGVLTNEKNSRFSFWSYDNLFTVSIRNIFISQNRHKDIKRWPAKAFFISGVSPSDIPPNKKMMKN